MHAMVVTTRRRSASWPPGAPRAGVAETPLTRTSAPRRHPGGRWTSDYGGRIDVKPASMKNVVTRLSRARSPRRGGALLAGLSPRQQLDAVYGLLLHRRADPAGVASYLPGLEAGTMTPTSWLSGSWRRASGGRWCRSPSSARPCTSAEASSCARCRRRARILDLGGTALGSDKGAMVLMGYPYPSTSSWSSTCRPTTATSSTRRTSSTHVTQTALGPGPLPLPLHGGPVRRMTTTPSTSSTAGQSIEHVAGGRGRPRPRRGGPGPTPRGIPRPRHPQRPRCAGSSRPRSSTPTTTTSTPTARWWTSCARRASRSSRPRVSTTRGALGGRAARSRSARWPPPAASSPTSRTATS